jgi:hypothetical protein
MLLPAGIGKRVGLASVLHALGISSRDVLGVGDAENDLDMLDGCDWRACPGDAVPEVYGVLPA